MAPKHPGGTAEEPAEAAEQHDGYRFVELRILDQTSGQRIRVTAPLGVTLRMPDGLHEVRLARFHPAFTRTRPPEATAATGSQPVGEGDKGASDAEREKGAEEAAPEGESPENGDSAPEKDEEKAESEAKPEPAELPAISDNPAVLLRVYRKGEPIGQSWVFKDYPTLFQPRNMRYTFYLINSAIGGNN